MDYEFSVAQCTLNADVKELLIFIASRCILNFTLNHRKWGRFYLSLIKTYILNDSFWPEFMVLIFLKKDNRVVFTTTLVSNVHVHVTTSFRLICIHCGVLLETKG